MSIKRPQWIPQTTQREKTLLLFLGLLVLLFWASIVAKQLSQNISSIREKAQVLNSQELYLKNKDIIQQRLEKAKEQLQATKTIGSDMLFTEMDSLARKNNFTFDLSSPQHEQNGLFTIHSIRLGIKQTKLDALIRFTQQIQEKSPYLNLTALRITPVANNPSLLNAQFEVQSFEFSQQL